MKWLPLALVLACAHHEPQLPPPQTDEQRDAKAELDKQHEYFEEYMTAARRDCTRRCALANAVCQKARRVCSIAESSPKQENELAPYCSIAQGRCEKVDKRLRSDYCPCWSSGPRVD
jgi:hypothetical protein